MEVTLARDPAEPTPLELRSGRWYKREDLLAYSNGVNGKVRTTLHLARYAAERGHPGLVYGGSVLAPALGRVASGAAYAGLECALVIGSAPETARRHPTVEVAYQAGAALHRAKVAYNPALQKRAREIAAETGYFQVPYGVSTPSEWTREQVRAFLECDGPQVQALARAGVETLVIPFGSANAAAGILYGLATYGSGSIRRVCLIGVGPDKREWLWSQLEYAGVTHQQPYGIEYLPLYPHFAAYKDRMPERQDGIDFHPTYEGKVVRFLDTLRPDWWVRRNGETCLWIVGGPLQPGRA